MASGEIRTRIYMSWRKMAYTVISTATHLRTLLALGQDFEGWSKGSKGVSREFVERVGFRHSYTPLSELEAQASVIMHTALL